MLRSSALVSLPGEEDAKNHRNTEALGNKVLYKIKILLEGRVLTNEEHSHLLHTLAEVQNGQEFLLTKYDPEQDHPHPFPSPLPLCVLLGIEPRASCILEKSSTT